MGNLPFGEFLHLPQNIPSRTTFDLLLLLLCSEMGELQFRRHFEECGAVEAVRLVRDKNSGLGKGFGYVLFQVRLQVLPSWQLDPTEPRLNQGKRAFSLVLVFNKPVFIYVE